MKSVEATTIIDGIVKEHAKLNMEIGKTIAEFVTTRGKDGETEKLYLEILKMTKDLPDADKAYALAVALEIVARNMGNVKKSEKAKHEGGSFKGGSSDNRSGSRFGGWGY